MFDQAGTAEPGDGGGSKEEGMKPALTQVFSV
jgi:hypothetical protein